jgi:hypothetical protein
MAQQALQNLGLNNNWDTASSGWKAGTDNNYLVLDGLVQPNVFTRATGAPPGSPAAGDRYLVPHTGAAGAWVGHADSYVAYSGSAWVFVSPLEGWSVYVSDEHKWLTWTGSAWVPRGLRASGAAAATATSVSGVLVLDTYFGEVFDVVLHENVTTLSLAHAVGAPNVTRMLVRLTQDGTGGWTIAWPPHTTPGGTPYVVSPAAGAVDLVRLTSFDAGLNWYLESAQAFA